jgi:hypothetical protein
VADAYSSEYLRLARSDLVAGRRNATAPDADPQPVRVTARRWRNGNPVAALPLAFRDTAGEFADNAVRARTGASLLLEDMLHAAGIIWLFDGASGTPPRLAEIARHIGTVREKNRGAPITTPVAFCISKIDQLPPADRARALADPKQAVLRAASPAVIELLETTFLNHRYFAISARGTDADQISPIGQNAVLDWVNGEYRRRQAGRFFRAHGRRITFALLALALLAGLGSAAAWYLYGEPAHRRRTAEQQRLGRLELAGQAYAAGAMDSVIALLHPPALSRRHDRAAEWDTLLAFAAFDAGFRHKLAGTNGDTLIAVSRDYLERALDQVDDPAAVARIRFKHAEACISEHCSARRIRNDLEYVVANSPDAQLVRTARERLAAVEAS